MPQPVKVGSLLVTVVRWARILGPEIAGFIASMKRPAPPPIQVMRSGDATDRPVEFEIWCYATHDGQKAVRRKHRAAGILVMTQEDGVIYLPFSGQAHFVRNIAGLPDKLPRWCVKMFDPPESYAGL